MPSIGWIARRAYPNWRRRSWKTAVMRMETDIAWHKRKKRQAVRRTLAERFSLTSTIAPAAIDIVNQFNNTNTGTGQRAWPEITGEPPVFGNYIGEFGHTSGGSWIWTGFSWERAILGG